MLLTNGQRYVEIGGVERSRLRGSITPRSLHKCKWLLLLLLLLIHINEIVNAEIDENNSDVVSEGKTFYVVTIEINVFIKSRQFHYWLKKKKR